MNKDNITDDSLSFTQKVKDNLILPQHIKDELMEIYNGTRIAPLTSAAMSERIFSPDINPDRFDFIMQRVLKDPTLISDGSATNIPLQKVNQSQKSIIGTLTELLLLLL